MFSGERIKEVFSLALEQKSPAQRDAFLAEACQSEPELRQQVESLLHAHEQAGNFLGEAGKLAAPNFVAERPGTIIGRYKLLELVGEGGFGTVWMAEQEQPVRRRVALKIIKPGMDTRQVLARFEAERQALAMMDHPSIARVFDGGATDTGRPYFVMELVRGLRITDYCDANKLSTRERLLLFIQVCQAVQHAHQKGIIHRDLKPSNILITEVDGAPVPKVIDFGVAKATQTRLTELTLFTGLHQMIGTPSYMSPEQAGLGALDIDTRSDIYGLGVLLYELLTSQTPLAADEFNKAGLDEIFKLIRERDPLKPSTRLSTLTNEQLTAIAAQRRAEPIKLNRLLSGDLDWIVMKSLEKDRRRRYETASALAADLVHHLNNEPVAARPPSNIYRLQKAWRRNKTVFAAGTLIVIVLLAATGISLRQAVRATRAETLAKQRLGESEAISKSLSEMIDHSYTVGSMNDNEPVFAYDDAGRHAGIDLMEKMLAFNTKVHGPDAPETVSAMENLAQAYGVVHRNEECIKLLEKVVAVRRKTADPKDSDLEQILETLSFAYVSVGRDQEGTATLAAACDMDQSDDLPSLRLAVWQAWFGQKAEYETTRRRMIERAQGTNAVTSDKRTDAATAERAAKAYCLLPSTNTSELAEALKLAERSVQSGEGNGWLPWDQMALGMAQYRNGDFAAAERTLTVVEKTMGGQRRDALGTTRMFRAMCLFREGRRDEAIQLFKDASSQMRQIPANERKPFGDQRPFNHEDLIAWLAFKEARTLLNQ